MLPGRVQWADCAHRDLALVVVTEEHASLGRIRLLKPWCLLNATTAQQCEQLCCTVVHVIKFAAVSAMEIWYA